MDEILLIMSMDCFILMVEDWNYVNWKTGYIKEGQKKYRINTTIVERSVLGQVAENFYNGTFQITICLGIVFITVT
jgi:hypothetical protein